jgi:hypothetical protein
VTRYFFHVSDGLETVHDEEGVELEDDEEALLEALRAIQDLREEEPDRDWSSHFLEIVDDAGRLILSSSFAVPSRAQRT